MKMNSRLILYAEDDPEDRLIFYDALEEIRVKIKVKILNDGTELLNYLQHKGAFEDRPENTDPELIILDLNMPKLGGYETLKKIRQDKKFGLIPVVIFSTSRSRTDVNKCYKSGANTFICKPDTFSELINKLNSLIEYWFETGELPKA